MTVTGPDFIALQVRDLGASTAFYTHRLGLQPTPAAPAGAVVFATAPIPFAIREPSVDLDATDRLGWGVALWLKAEDVDAVHGELVRHGVPIVTAPFDGPFGRTFSFADPDGYVVTLHG
jgi:predicted enzyme related to lactoylglutathione lyase